MVLGSPWLLLTSWGCDRSVAESWSDKEWSISESQVIGHCWIEVALILV